VGDRERGRLNKHKEGTSTTKGRRGLRNKVENVFQLMESQGYSGRSYLGRPVAVSEQVHTDGSKEHMMI
jgi:hypothetical protein